MKVRVVVLLAAATLACLTVVSGAEATTQRGAAAAASAGGTRTESSIAGTIAGELAKAGVKAAIAHFAPGLAKALDPGSAQLAAIQEQLAALDSKVTELTRHQERLEARLNCSIQRSGMSGIVSRAQTALESLIAATQLPTEAGRTARLDSLYADFNELTHLQHNLHLRLASEGGLRACAEHIEKGMAPFLTSQLAPAVHDFYATYEAAALSLLVVRLNVMAYKPAAYLPNEAESKAALNNVTAWIADEKALIKPALPSSESYDTNTQLLYKTHTFGFSDSAATRSYRAAGWSVSGDTYFPECSVLINLSQETGITDRALARQELIRRNVLQAPKEISCFDDHYGLYVFDLDRFLYIKSTLQNMRSLFAARVVVRHGFPDVAKFSYTQK